MLKPKHSEQRDYRKTVVVRDKDTDIQFEGYLMAEVSSQDFNPGIKRWAILALYCTRGGKYICEQIGCSTIEGETDRCSGHVADTIDDVVTYFGGGWLAKELYQAAGIDAITYVA